LSLQENKSVCGATGVKPHCRELELIVPGSPLTLQKMWSALEGEGLNQELYWRAIKIALGAAIEGIPNKQKNK